MASYKGVQGTLTALEDFFKNRLPEELSAEPTNATVKLLGSNDIASTLSGNLLGIYLHRLTIDDHGRSRYLQPQGGGAQAANAELPVNLHFFLIAYATSATIEADLMAWAMVEIANHSQIDISHVQDVDDEWGDYELLNVTPDDMSTEDLMRIWDVFESSYTSTMTYTAKTIRLRLNPMQIDGEPVKSRIFPTGRV